MLADLDWLEPATDFRVRLKAVRAAIAEGTGDEEQLYALALGRLDLNQLGQLAGAVASYVATDAAPGPLARVRLGVIGSGTLGLIEPAIAASALRHRVIATVVGGDYGSAMQDAIDPQSALRTAGLDLALIALDYRTLGLDRAQPNPGAAVDAAAAMVGAMVDGLAASAAGGVMVATIVPPVEPLFGSFDAVEPGSVAAQVAALNARLADWARDKRIVLVDIARVAAWVGLDRWHDAGQWHSAKLPFDPDLIPLYADVVARTIAAVRGTTRKCLVLDLDNTLWGGIIGDDGVDGIALGQGSAKGEAFLAIQQMALGLRQRGIILAVCSKNDDDVARIPFRDHPDMPLKEAHIASFVANWGDKATNLRAIASALNIGLDSLVFLDDNPVERAQVRRERPLVAVPEVPADPALYPRILLGAGYFEAVAFAQEDRDRADQYRANAERAAFAGTSDMVGYLASLDMVADIRPFDAVNRARIAQLINKSNQFNLTTRRYTEAQVAALEADPAKLTMQVRLTDRFGDNGMISVIVVDRATWEIDTWLMSCRVLGRRMEEAVLAHIAAAARDGGASALTGRYLPSVKNKMVAGHFGKLGFAKVSGEDGKETVWRLDLADYAAPELPMRIVDGS
ncbi:HAD-IIIC family phosphatase [Glacieibacterium megasporae]|uniref:HAD-IIIC family phosphatase n=1 Tax=Glacieibacterium megasporae TaxID=2835787 RepID=UPI001C1DEE83|nr:HAD-IIIC family phosphatase [Polymorphobacter megasporae]UAJ11549.1 HAD-IIIC family phosphatase [Polymorphobacter megasporae]